MQGHVKTRVTSSIYPPHAISEHMRQSCKQLHYIPLLPPQIEHGHFRPTKSMRLRDPFWIRGRVKLDEVRAA